MKNIRPCECCNGNGFHLVLSKHQSHYKKALELMDRGLSYRKIACHLGLNHPQTVKNLLDNN